MRSMYFFQGLVNCIMHYAVQNSSKNWQTPKQKKNISKLECLFVTFKRKLQCKQMMKKLNTFPHQERSTGMGPMVPNLSARWCEDINKFKTEITRSITWLQSLTGIFVKTYDDVCLFKHLGWDQVNSNLMSPKHFPGACQHHTGIPGEGWLCCYEFSSLASHFLLSM